MMRDEGEEEIHKIKAYSSAVVDIMERELEQAQVQTHEEATSVEEVQEWVKAFGECTSVEPILYEVSLIYVQRLLLSQTKLRLKRNNWRAILSTSLLVAGKFFIDIHYRNSDFAFVLDCPLEDINRWEREFVAGLRYNLHVDIPTFALKEFELRDKKFPTMGTRGYKRSFDSDESNRSSPSTVTTASESSSRSKSRPAIARDTFVACSD